VALYQKGIDCAKKISKKKILSLPFYLTLNILNLITDIKAQLNMKNAEVSECKIHVDELKTQVNCEIKSREELQLHYQSRLREKQAEIDSYRK
jgi:hypothetical protein